MKATNPFDTAITVRKGMSAATRAAAIELTDTLDLCWAAAQAVFEKQAKPEHAIALLPMFMERSDAKRRQQEAELMKHTARASTPPSTRRRKTRGQRQADLCSEQRGLVHKKRGFERLDVAQRLQSGEEVGATHWRPPALPAAGLDRRWRRRKGTSAHPTRHRASGLRT